ncbi:MULTISPECIES: TetR/AcrR family transcriptional regulator [unclassified Streptomyces]|uniref:TetR/AcrR family transcriptional regulator n=1 Tax=unclassified Streptomyces TaxID=2593676 RepID=UPI000DBA9F85|nr:TetR/AcrR family transcriptional regulator [Streptomyces sp. PsTaAH-137]MYT75497.1 TetR family transcriptional regulator [Streptomyces sp. SID8367]RAJ86902.1 TetR family transcriptional regulator [Streptomyces sp. PsTaAH-137]
MAARRRQAAQEWATRTARDRTDAPARGRLLDAAEAVFGRLGYGPATIADITAEAEVSRAGFYVYFASKDEVFRVLARRVRDAFLAAQDVPGVDTDDVAAVAEASTAAFIAAYARHLPLLVLLEQQARGDDEVRALWEEIRERPVRRAARYVRRVAAEGRARPVVDPLTLSRAVGGMSVEFARTVAARPASYDAAVRDVTTMYRHLLGIGAPDRQ